MDLVLDDAAEGQDAHLAPGGGCREGERGEGEHARFSALEGGNETCLFVEISKEAGLTLRSISVLGCTMRGVNKGVSVVEMRGDEEGRRDGDDDSRPNF